ncbi:membrane protein containing DUF1232 [Candidatus Magnetoovum chiemensis]|nr:membrane protein containing DUF1232 [Candidatus Magnetoovum chiemensis]
MFIGVIAAYALSPIDLIPDFIPILGYLDELLLLPAAIALALRMIPKELLDEYRDRALDSNKACISSSWFRRGAVLVAAVWIVIVTAVIYAYLTEVR